MDEYIDPTVPGEDTADLSEEVSEEVTEEVEDSESTEEQDRDEKGRFKPKQTAQDRINEITAKFREEERKRQVAEAMNQTLLQQMQAAPMPAGQSTFSEPEPRLEDFSYDPVLHAQAVGAWQVRREVHDKQTAVDAQSNRGRQVQMEAEWNVRKKEFAAQYPDFDVKVQDPSLPVTDSMAEVIKSSPRGPEIAYYLAENRDIANEISHLPASVQAYRLGLIEAKMETKPRPPGTPPPVKPIAGGGGASSSNWKNDPNISPEEWARRRNEELGLTPKRK